MNWSAKHLTTVDKERIWKEYVSKESENRVVNDDFRQRVTDKTRDPEVKLSPRGKKFMTKEPYGIRMEVNPETGRMTPVLTEKVTLSGLRSPSKSPTKQQRSGHEALSSNGGTPPNSNSNSNSRPTSNAGGGGGGVRLPALPLSTSAMLQAQQENQRRVMGGGGGNSPTAAGNSPTAAAAGLYTNTIASKNSPRKNQSSLQEQYLQNNYRCNNAHHYANNGTNATPEAAALDRSLKNLQFLSTTNSAIGRGTVEVLQGVSGGTRHGLQGSNPTSGTTSPSHPHSSHHNNNNNTNTPAAGMNSTTTASGDFGSSLSGTLRATYQQASGGAIPQAKGEYIPGSPRSYVVKGGAGGALFEYGKKHCDITRTHQELTLRK